MFSTRLRIAGTFSAFLLLATYLSAQSVVAAHSGIVHYLEGSVSVDGQVLEPKFGKFHDLKPGAVLQTDGGRAEILLTPGVLLRVDENSSIRMVSNRLSDTRVEFIGGSAAVDSREVDAGPPVLITYKTCQVRFAEPGRYRIDSAPAQLRVDEGKAEATCSGKAVSVAAGHVLPVNAALTARQAPPERGDAFDGWVKKRTQALVADNTAAAASGDMADALDAAGAGSYGYGSPGAPGYGAPGYGYPSPADLWAPGTFSSPFGYLSPFSPYPGPLQTVLYIPLYRRPVGLGGSRGLSGPLTHGYYTPPPAWRRGGPIRTTPPPVHRPAMPALHAPIHAVGHR